MDAKRLQLAQKLAARPYTLIYVPDETGYYALVKELPGCSSDGDTLAEARANIEAAKVDFIYVMLKYQQPIPEPRRLGPRVILNMSDFADSASINATPTFDESNRFVANSNFLQVSSQA